MIFDALCQAHHYTPLHPLLAKAFAWLGQTQLADLACGKHVIDGEELFALVQDYNTKPLPEARWEAHRRYWDIQVVVRGSERIGFAQLSHMTQTVPYDPQADIAWFTGSGNFVVVPSGHFCIFAPHDVHAPGLAAESPEPVRKVVVKVAA